LLTVSVQLLSVHSDYCNVRTFLREVLNDSHTKIVFFFQKKAIHYWIHDPIVRVFIVPVNQQTRTHALL